MKKSKTIYDCTVDEIGSLARAAIDLHAMAAFYLWLNGADTDDDQSWRNPLDRMREALIACGLDALTYEESCATFRETLSLPPEEFLRRLDIAHEEAPG